MVGQDLPHAVDDLPRTGRDARHGLLGHGGPHPVPPQLPQQVVRVAGDAVPPDAGAGVEGHEAVGLGRRGGDDLHDRQVEDPAHVGELVGEGDVDGAEGVLHQLDHLGRGGGRDGVDPGGVATEQCRGPPLALLRHAADDAGDVLQQVHVVARVDPLGAEGHEHVRPRLEAAGTQRLDQQVGRAPDVGGRREHEDLARPGVLDDGATGPAQRPQVGDEVLVDGRGDADDHGVGLGQPAGVVGGDEAAGTVVLVGDLSHGLAQEPREPLLVTREEIRLPGRDRGQPRRAGVQTQDRAPGRRERQGGGQPDIAETHHGDVVGGGGARLDDPEGGGRGEVGGEHDGAGGRGCGGRR